MTSANTSFATTVPMAHALWPVAEAELNQRLDWTAQPGKKLQELILRLKNPSLALAATLSAKELASCAARTAAPVNEFLHSKGFHGMDLADRGSVNMIYAASVMKLLGPWLNHGQKGFRLEKIRKPGFRLPGDGLKHFICRGNRVVVVPTSGGFSFLVTKPTGAIGFDMLEDWTAILHSMKPTAGNGLVLPMAAINETKINVGELEGLHTPEALSPWVVEEALMAAKFGLTPSMVKFEAAFAFSARCLGIDFAEPEAEDYWADHPLYFSLVKSGHWLPLAAGLVDPADLSDIDLD